MADISPTGMTQVDHHHTARYIGVSELAVTCCLIEVMTFGSFSEQTVFTQQS